MFQNIIFIDISLNFLLYIEPFNVYVIEKDTQYLENSLYCTNSDIFFNIEAHILFATENNNASYIFQQI